MEDDDALGVSSTLIDFVIVEVKTGRCALNGPWTAPEKRNIQRVLLATGPLERERVDDIAAALYTAGHCVVDATLRFRLVTIGSEPSADVARDFPEVTQLTWASVLEFIHARFQAHRDHKTDVEQWTDDGRLLQRLARNTRDCDTFVRDIQRRMGVPQSPPRMHTRPDPSAS
jgi:hypothetical protein